MRAAITLLTVVGSLASCEGPPRYDSSNPVHCLTVFSLASAGATAADNADLAEDMNARMAALAASRGGSEWIARVTPEARRLAATLEGSADPSVGQALFQHCSARHPARR